MVSAPRGVSVLTGLSVPGFYKASWDQLNYDAVGDTDTVSDSFVVPGTTYVIRPSGRALDADSGYARELCRCSARSVAVVPRGSVRVRAVTCDLGCVPKPQRVYRRPCRVRAACDLWCQLSACTASVPTASTSACRSRLVHLLYALSLQATCRCPWRLHILCISGIEHPTPPTTPCTASASSFVCRTGSVRTRCSSCSVSMGVLPLGEPAGRSFTSHRRARECAHLQGQRLRVYWTQRERDGCRGAAEGQRHWIWCVRVWRAPLVWD